MDKATPDTGGAHTKARNTDRLRSHILRIAADEDLDAETAVQQIRELVRGRVRVTIGDRSPHRPGRRRRR